MIAPDAGPPADEPPLEGPPGAEAIRVLVENHRVFRAFLERRLGDKELARDLLQEAFLRGLSRIETLRADEAATAWFYRTLRNAIVDLRRRQASRARTLDAFEAELGGAAEPPRDVRDEVCACVARLAATLKPEYRDALQRVEIDGAPLQDYAAEAGITANNAGVRLFRARKKLRERVVLSCGTCAEHGCFACTCDAGRCS